ALEVVELAVDDGVQRAVLVGERLVAGVKIDDAEPRVAEADAPPRRQPLLLAIGPAVMEDPGGGQRRLLGGWVAARERRHGSAHAPRVEPGSMPGARLRRWRGREAARRPARFAPRWR